MSPAIKVLYVAMLKQNDFGYSYVIRGCKVDKTAPGFSKWIIKLLERNTDEIEYGDTGIYF